MGRAGLGGLHADPIGGGRSNLTYRVDSPAGRVVLRRPPVGQVAATAHDMGRERRVISALAGTDVPVPRVLAHADGGPPVDAPCYVMEYLEGVVPLAELPAGWAGTEPERRRAGAALVDVLVRLHAVDPEAVGLADFGRPEGFLARQVRRWNTQWARRSSTPMREVPTRPTAAELTRLADALAAQVPATQRHTIVHGDYRIDNCLYDAADPGRILAVLDWELSTLGDPLADLGLLLVYWHQADDRPSGGRPSTCPARPRLPGFPGRAEIARAYAAALRPGSDPTAVVRRVRLVQTGRRAGRHRGPGAGRDGAGVDGRGPGGQRRPAGRSGASRACGRAGLMRRIGSTARSRPYQRRRRGPVIAVVTVLAAAALVTWTSVLVNASGPAPDRACPTPVAGPGPRARCCPPVR